MNKDLKPIEANSEIGFHYTVTEEQIKQHQQRSIAEIFEWLEETNKFIYNVQTEKERELMKKIRTEKL